MQPVDHPADRFSEAELARLLDEPLLKVQLLDMGEAEQLPADLAKADKADAKTSAKAPAKAGK
ncbi:hypothetical protein D3C84_1210350 [compost metagenome]